MAGIWFYGGPVLGSIDSFIVMGSRGLRKGFSFFGVSLPSLVVPISEACLKSRYWEGGG